MKKLLSFLVSYSIFALMLQAQVPSNIYSEKSKVFDIYPFFETLRTSAPEVLMPSFTINQLKEEDLSVKDFDVPYRFGKGFEVEYSLNNGYWEKLDYGNIWLLKVTSLGAYSLNFVFNELFLPIGSEMYIYSYDGSMVYGPITSDQNLKENTLFLTDVIKGESVVLYLFVPEDKRADAKLKISKIVHGYKDIYAGLFESENKTSGSCEKDVTCYPTWSFESDAVAHVLLASADAWCSGSLLNNTNQDFKAFFLTAFHCIDVNQNGEISSSEESDAENWMFKFHYKKTTCDGSQIASTITYNHDNLRAAWSTSDFALLELVNSPLYNMCLSFLGWDRTGNTPSQGTSIHHPSGDVMKISFDTDPLLETSLGQNSGSNYWRVIWNTGATEEHSSGASLFDQNKRVIGQLAGGNSICDGSDMRDWFGCFDVSWTGGGTSSTRLSDWLGSGFTTLNTLRLNGEISGPNMVCNSNSTFTLNNAPSGSSVTWSASFVTPSSGSGTTAVFKSTCILGAVGYITFTISNPCISTGSVQVTKSYLSAGPNPLDVELYVCTSYGQPAHKYGQTWVLCPNSTYHIYLINNSSCSTSNYTWVLPPSLTKNYQFNNMISVNTNSTPGGNILVYSQTCCSDCGSNVRILSAYVGTDYNCGYGFSMYPNPTSDAITITINETAFAISRDINELDQVTFKIRFYNSMGTLVSTVERTGVIFDIPLPKLSDGTYIVEVSDGKYSHKEQLMVKH